MHLPGPIRASALASLLASSSLFPGIGGSCFGGETPGFVFLNSPIPAAEAAAAGAVVASEKAPRSSFQNPAAFAQLERSAAALHGGTMWEDVQGQELFYGRPAVRGGWGAFFNRTNVAGLERVRYDVASPDRYTTEGALNAGDIVVGAAAGRRLRRLVEIGAGVKFIDETLDDHRLHAVAFDAGATGWVDQTLRWGVALFNAGPEARGLRSAVPLPTRLQAGLKKSASPRVEWEVDVAQPFRGSGEVLLGGQFQEVEGRAVLRAGYRLRLKDNDLGEWSGLSMGIGARWGDAIVDYAVIPFGDFGVQHRAGLSWQWGVVAPPATRRARRQPLKD